MTRIQRPCPGWLAGLYGRVLRLYPRPFREEFAEEMVAVFRQLIDEAGRRGRPFLVSLLLREARGVVVAAAGERARQLKRGKEADIMTSLDLTVASDAGATGEDQGGSWKGAILGALPVFLYGLSYVGSGFEYALNKVPADGAFLELVQRLLTWLPDMELVRLFLLLVGLAGIAAGWWRGFPRWTAAYAGVAVMYSAWLSDVRTTYQVFNRTIFVESWGWRAWIPLLAVVGLMWLLTHSRRPLRRLGGELTRDWTWLSLLLYAGAVLLLIGASYDNKTWYERPLRLPGDVALITLLFTGGALAHLLLPRRWQRGLALGLSLCIYLLVNLTEVDSLADRKMAFFGLFGIWLAPIWFPAVLSFVLRKVLPRRTLA